MTCISAILRPRDAGHESCAVMPNRNVKPSVTVEVVAGSYVARVLDGLGVEHMQSLVSHCSDSLLRKVMQWPEQQ